LVLDADGVPRGSVELPRNAQVHWIDGATFVWVDLDEYEIPWVVRSRLSLEG
jgi:hypothetical protein